MPNLAIMKIDPGAANAGGLKTMAIKFKFRGANGAEQYRSAKLLAQCMKDSEVVPIDRAVDLTLDLDGTAPEDAVRMLFNDTNQLVRPGDIIYTATEEAVTLLRDLVRCGEALLEMLLGLAAVKEWPEDEAA